MICLKIDVTASRKDRFRDDLMSSYGRDVEWCTRMCILVVDEGLYDLCRQQYGNLHSVSITCGLTKLFPRHTCMFEHFPFFVSQDKKWTETDQG